jgi:hypothetical protein
VKFYAEGPRIWAGEKRIEERVESRPRNRQHPR